MKALKKTVSLKVFSISLILCSLLVGSLVYLATAQSGSISTPFISPGPWPGAPGFTVWCEGTEYYAKNRNGYIAYSGIDASTVVQAAINAAPNSKILLLHSMEGAILNTGLISASGSDLIIEGESPGNYTNALLFNGTGACFSLYTAGKAMLLSHLIIEPGKNGLCAIDMATACHSIVKDVTLFGSASYYWDCGVWMSNTKRYNGTAFTSSDNSFDNDLEDVRMRATPFHVESLPNNPLIMNGGGTFNNHFQNCWFTARQQTGTDKGAYLNGSLVQLNTFTACVISGTTALHITDSNENDFIGCDIEATFGQVLRIETGRDNHFWGGFLTQPTTFNMTLGTGARNTIRGATMGDTTVGWGRSENVGSHAIGAGSNTSCTFNHGLAFTPIFVVCSFAATGYGSYKWSASYTQITVTIQTSVATTVYWSAQCTP